MIKLLVPLLLAQWATQGMRVSQGGAAQGYATQVNCTGTGATCTSNGTVWTLNFTGGGGGGAPTDAQYLVMAPSTGLSAEVVVPTCSAGQHLFSNGTAITCTADAAPTTPTLDQIGNPTADKTFNMANRNLVWNYTAPAGADGAFEIQATGGFSGDLLHVHQHTGSPVAGTDLIHAEWTSSAVTGLKLTGPSSTATAATITGAASLSGTLTLGQTTGNRAIQMTSGARLDLGGGGNDYLSSDGAQISTPGSFQAVTFNSPANAGSNAVALATTGARVDLGTGSLDYIYSDGTNVSTGGGLSAGGLVSAPAFQASNGTNNSYGLSTSASGLNSALFLYNNQGSTYSMRVFPNATNARAEYRANAHAWTDLAGNNLTMTVTPGAGAAVTGTMSATSFSGPLTGNASTATALFANGSNCLAGLAAQGVDASGNAEGCFTPTAAAPGAAGNVPYNNGSGSLTAEAALSYDASQDQLTVGTATTGSVAVNVVKSLRADMVIANYTGIDNSTIYYDIIANYGSHRFQGGKVYAPEPSPPALGGWGASLNLPLPVSDVSFTPETGDLWSANGAMSNWLPGLMYYDGTASRNLLGPVTFPGTIPTRQFWRGDGTWGQIPAATSTLLGGVKMAAACSAGYHVASISGAGELTCTADTGGGGTPAGSNTQIQFNDNGAFGGSDNLTFDGYSFSTGRTYLYRRDTSGGGGTDNPVLYLRGSPADATPGADGDGVSVITQANDTAGASWRIGRITSTWIDATNLTSRLDLNVSNGTHASTTSPGVTITPTATTYTTTAGTVALTATDDSHDHGIEVHDDGSYFTGFFAERAGWGSVRLHVSTSPRLRLEDANGLVQLENASGAASLTSPVGVSLVALTDALTMNGAGGLTFNDGATTNDLLTVDVTEINATGRTNSNYLRGDGTWATPPGGTGSVNSVEVDVDFGSPWSDDVASTVVTGQTWVTATSKITCSPTMLATTSREEGMEDAVIEGLTVAVHSRVAGTGFTVTAAAANNLGTTGVYKIHCIGG